jgi:CDP-paratose 2-epimerase
MTPHSILEAAARHRAGVVILSTSRVYSIPALALEYGHRYGTPCIIDRCGVMAGAGQFGRADQGIFSWWIRQWIADKPLAYIGFGGRGLRVRDCLHPDDLMPLLVAQLASPPPAPEIFNVSGGGASATRLAQLSQWCHEHLGAYAGPQPIAATAGNVQPSVPR